MDAGGAAELDPIDELVERHPVFHLHRLGPLVKRDDPVPWIADKAKFEIGFELAAADVDLAGLWEKLVERAANPIRSTAEMRPRIFHQRFDFHQVEMGNIGFAENGADAGRAGLGHLDKNA